MKPHEIKSGIYKIQSRKFPDKLYIGSSKDIDERWLFHLSLMKFKNRNYKLAFHVRIFGVEDLSISILKLCHPDHLVYWEQYYISELNPCFNLHRFASEPNSESIKAKQSAFEKICPSLFHSELNVLMLGNEYKEEIVPFNIL
jgi:group I intron endonuclease